MEDPELDEARKKKLESKKTEEQLKATLRMALEESAYDRLMNVSVANRELFLETSRNILVFFKRAGRKVTESELLSLLRALKERDEKKTSIKFHKK